MALKDVKLRYYYTIDGEKDQQFNVDYATLGGSNVLGSFVKLTPAATGADYYVEISFTAGAGSLAPGANTGKSSSASIKPTGVIITKPATIHMIRPKPRSQTGNACRCT